MRDHERYCNRRLTRLFALLPFLLILSFIFGAFSNTTIHAKGETVVVTDANETSNGDIVMNNNTTESQSGNANQKILFRDGVLIMVVIIIGVFFMYLNKLSKKEEIRLEREFEMSLFEDVSLAIKDDVSIPSAKLHDLLASKHIENAFDYSDLSSIARIEYNLSKIDPHRVSRMVLVAVKNGDSVSVKKVTREYPWENLPRSVRSKFIMEQQDSFTHLLYPVNEKGE